MVERLRQAEWKPARHACGGRRDGDLYRHESWSAEPIAYVIAHVLKVRPRDIGLIGCAVAQRARVEGRRAILRHD
jgi:hypothetical protein